MKRFETFLESADSSQFKILEYQEQKETNDQIESAVEYFYEEGINEEGLDLIIEEVGVDDFVEFISESALELNEERAARRASVRAKKFPEVKAAVDKADAAKKKAKKGEYAASYAKKETDVTDYGDDKPAAKKAPVKKAVVKKVAPKPAAKKVVQSVKKAKVTQPKKPASKQGLRDRITTAYKAGVKRHKKAVQPARVFAKGFKRGVSDTVKFAGKAKKAVVGEKFDYDPMDDPDFDPHEAEKKRGVSGKNNPKGGKKLKDLTKEEVVVEKDLNAAERRALPDKEFALPGKGKGPEGKQAGSYPIPDKNHARMALAMVAKHGTPEKKEKVRAAVAKKFPGIKQEEVEVGEAYKAVTNAPDSLAKMNKRYKPVKKIKNPTDRPFRDRLKDPDYKVDMDEAKVDAGKSADEKATARNQRNNPKKGDKGFGKFATSVFIKRKEGQSLAWGKDSAASEKRREAHAKRRGVSEESQSVNNKNRSDQAFKNVVAKLQAKHGKDAVITKDNPIKPLTPTQKRKAMLDKQNRERQKAAQDTRSQAQRNVDAQYGGEANRKAGRGLGT